MKVLAYALSSFSMLSFCVLNPTRPCTARSTSSLRDAMTSPCPSSPPMPCLATCIPEFLENSELLLVPMVLLRAPGPSQPDPYQPLSAQQCHLQAESQAPAQRSHFLHLRATWLMAVCLLHSKLWKPGGQHCCGTSVAPGFGLSRALRTPDRNCYSASRYYIQKDCTIWGTLLIGS